MSSAILLISNSECRGQGPLVDITDFDKNDLRDLCKSKNVKVGLALHLETPAMAVEKYLPLNPN